VSRQGVLVAVAIAAAVTVGLILADLGVSVAALHVADRCAVGEHP